MDGTSQLRRGSWVRIKSRSNINSSLDDSGMLDGLPFMAEMGDLCGQVFRVRSLVGKTCVDARPMEMRAFPRGNVFLLEGVRCSGVAHDACERDCLVFWRQEWLEPVAPPEPAAFPPPPLVCVSALPSLRASLTYTCQSTALRNATRLLSRRDRWAVLWRDWRCGNLNLIQLCFRTAGPMYRKLRRGLRGSWPRGRLKKTPTAALGLKAGDLVRVRPLSEIKATLDGEGRNRGLVFEPDMAAFCGRTLRVRRQVRRMILESTGKMIDLMHTVTLEEVTCSCPFAFGGCPRAELHLWREIWLELCPR